MKNIFPLGLLFLFSLACSRPAAAPERISLDALRQAGTGDTEITVMVKDVPLTLVPVEGGYFTMGHTLEQGVIKNPKFKPVLVSGFVIGKTEVTQDLWEAVMGKKTDGNLPGSAPAVGVSWNESVRFVQKLSRLTGLPFRLPTEAEWEFAARGGNVSRHTLYSGSKDLSVRTNELGLENMSGGVWEWCSDVYEESSAWPDSLTVDPQGPSNPKAVIRVQRGGCDADKSSCVISSRRPAAKTDRSNAVGLRVALSTDAGYDPVLDAVLRRNQVPRETTNDADLKIEVFNVNGVSFRMMPVKGGTFEMGATPEHTNLSKDDEKPVHTVTLDSFRIGEYEVTGELWYAVMGYLPSYFYADKKPVCNVTWYDAQSFIRQLNALTGRTFRLPTEAEWEFAARGGVKSRKTPFAGGPYARFVAVHEREDRKVQPVGSMRIANEVGTYDMSGNAWEWCQDVFGPYPAEAQVNPTGPASGKWRVIRGGSAGALWDKCRTSNRSEASANYFQSTYGFRLAM